jgi:anti-sigma-K factor RskA
MNERDAGQEHEELQTLLGAYALNATDALEARRIERHLETCDDCANEVRMLRETTAELAWLSEPAEAGDLVDRISQRLPARRRRLITRLSAGVAAVAVATAGFLGASLLRAESENARLADVLATATRRVPLGAQKGFAGHGVLHVASGKAALVLDDLPDAGRDRTYQLWAITGSKPRSMTVVGGTGRVVAVFDWKGAGDRFAVTIEPDGGSPVPTSDPVLIGV